MTDAEIQEYHDLLIWLWDETNHTPLYQFQTIQDYQDHIRTATLKEARVGYLYHQSRREGNPMSVYPPGHASAPVAEIINILDDWAQSIDDGTVNNRHPDLNYTRASGKEDWTEEELDVFVRNLDWEHDQEVTRAPGTGIGAKRGPGFVRLNYEQRLAMAQELDAALAHYPLVDFPSSTNHEAHTTSGYFRGGDYVSPEHYPGYEPDRSYMDQDN